MASEIAQRCLSRKWEPFSGVCSHTLNMSSLPCRRVGQPHGQGWELRHQTKRLQRVVIHDLLLIDRGVARDPRHHGPRGGEAAVCRAAQTAGLTFDRFGISSTAGYFANDSATLEKACAAAG